MQCPSCNSEVPEGKRFCGYCGHALVSMPADAFDDNAITRVDEAPFTPDEKFDDDAPTSLADDPKAGVPVSDTPKVPARPISTQPPVSAPPAPPRKSAIPGWVWGLGIGGVVLVVLMIIAIIGVIGVVDMGSQPSEVIVVTEVVEVEKKVTQVVEVEVPAPTQNSNPTSFPTNTPRPTATKKPDTSTVYVAPGPSVYSSRTTSQELDDLPNIWEVNGISSLDLASPGMRQYQVPANPSDRLIWAYFWCASDDATLDANLQHLNVRFNIDGEQVPSNNIYEFPYDFSGWACWYWATTLSNWQSGKTTVLDITYHFSQSVHDGYQSYPAGDYTFRLTVDIR